MTGSPSFSTSIPIAVRAEPESAGAYPNAQAMNVNRANYSEAEWNNTRRWSHGR